MAKNYEDEIWLSDICGTHGLIVLPSKQGICVKHYGSEWPEQTHFSPNLSEHENGVIIIYSSETLTKEQLRSIDGELKPLLA